MISLDRWPGQWSVDHEEMERDRTVSAQPGNMTNLGGITDIFLTSKMSNHVARTKNLQPIFD